MTMPAPHEVSRRTEPYVACVEALLRVHDLDGRHHRQEHQDDRLAEEQRPERVVAPDVVEPFAQPRPPDATARARRPAVRARSPTSDGHHARRAPRQPRRRRPGPSKRDQCAGSDGRAGVHRGEAEVQRGVALAQLAGGLEEGHRRCSRRRARDRRKRSVGQREDEHQRQPEAVRREREHRRARRPRRRRRCPGPEPTGSPSRRAVRAGTKNAGRNFAATNSAVVASGSCVAS